MESFNVVVTVSTTVCIAAESADDAIEKVSQALNNGDANMSADVASNIGYSMRNGHYEVTNAIPMDEDYDEGSGNEEDDESEEWEQHNRREGNFYPIMEFLHSAGEQLLREDIRRYDIKPAVIRTKEEMHEFYRTQPDEMILAALVEVDDKVTGKRYCSIRVWCSGHEVKTRSMGSYYVLNKHYLTVNKDDMVATYPYPFSCDDGANTLLEAKDTDILTPVERLFLWTEYKNPNPIETKKKQGESIMNTYNVVISVSATVCIDAESADDAIEKVSQALNNDDANMSADVASRIGDSMRNGHYEVTNAIPMDE